jgi:uncharacterized protein YpuA (DUF1002 family)
MKTNIIDVEQTFYRELLRLSKERLKDKRVDLFNATKYASSSDLIDYDKLTDDLVTIDKQLKAINQEIKIHTPVFCEDDIPF